MSEIKRLAAAAQSASVNQLFSWENAVRAVLEAMREPSNDLSDAMIAGYYAGVPFASDDGTSGIGMRQAWRAGIDALLQPATEGAE